MEFYLRPVRVGDAKGMNELRRMPGVFENILGIPSEPLKRNEDFIVNQEPNLHAFVAIAKCDDGDERLIGCASLSVYPNHRMRHSAGIGIMVHKDYQNQGVGTKLMETLLDVADNWLMLIRVELTVFVDNERAINLYRKMGFEIEGVKKKAAIRFGEYIDEYMMARIK